MANSSDSLGILSMSSLAFKFYCKRVNKTLGLNVDYWNITGVLNLKKAKIANALSLDSCFNSTSGYSFDSTGNIMYINSLSLSPSVDFNNILTTVWTSALYH